MPNFVVSGCFYSFKVSVFALSLSQRLIVVFPFYYIYGVSLCVLAMELFMITQGNLQTREVVFVVVW